MYAEVDRVATTRATVGDLTETMPGSSGGLDLPSPPSSLDDEDIADFSDDEDLDARARHEFEAENAEHLR